MKKRFYLLAMLLTVWNDLCGQGLRRVPKPAAKIIAFIILS